VFTFTFDISTLYTYENKVKDLIQISSTLISFNISVLETTLLIRIFLCFFSPKKKMQNS